MACKFDAEYFLLTFLATLIVVLIVGTCQLYNAVLLSAVITGSINIVGDVLETCKVLLVGRITLSTRGVCGEAACRLGQPGRDA